MNQPERLIHGQQMYTIFVKRLFLKRFTTQY